MKKILLLFSAILFAITTYAQFNTKMYPKIETDSLGNKVVIFTIEQARDIDNKLDILELLEKTNNLNSDVDSVYIKIINEKDQVIAKQDILINNLNQSIGNKDKQIDNLKTQIADYMTKEILYDKQLKNKDEEIQLNLDKIKDLKKKMIIGGSVGGCIITGLVILLLIH